MAASGCGRPFAAESSEASQAPATSAAVDRVAAGKPRRKTLALHTTQPGRIEAFEETPLFPKVAGYVEQAHVDIGDHVAKGQVLLALSVPEMRNERAQKEALVAQREAEVKQAEAGIGRAKGEYARWQSEHQWIKELAGKGSVTTKLVDETLNQFQSAEAALTEALANVESAKAGFSESQANRSKAQAKRRVAKANLAYTATMPACAEIKAPFDGVATDRGVDTGHYVYPASGGAAKPLLVVARADKVRILVDVPEMEAPLVDGGERAESAIVRVQALRGRELEARVTRTGWSLGASNRSLRTEIDIANDDALLRPGMYATATILLEKRDARKAGRLFGIADHGGHPRREDFVLLLREVRPCRAEVRPCRAKSGRAGTEERRRSGNCFQPGRGRRRRAGAADSLQAGRRVEVIEPEK